MNDDGILSSTTQCVIALYVISILVIIVALPFVDLGLADTLWFMSGHGFLIGTLVYEDVTKAFNKMKHELRD